MRDGGQNSMNTIQDKKLRESIRVECLRLWKGRLEEESGYYSVNSSESPDASIMSNKCTAPDVDSFIENCSSLLLSLECTENQVAGAIALILDQLPKTTWRDETVSGLQQLFGGEGTEGAVGYEVSWVENTAPDLALLEARIDLIKPLLMKYIGKDIGG
jgi:hypothetical protein